jgi:hypothetical protein
VFHLVRRYEPSGLGAQFRRNKVAIDRSGVQLLAIGPDLECSGLWDGFDIKRIGPDELGMADLVVLAFVEYKPRRLLLAPASGIPVIASTACCLDGVQGVETTDIVDPVMLGDLITIALSACRSNNSLRASN